MRCTDRPSGLAQHSAGPGERRLLGRCRRGPADSPGGWSRETRRGSPRPRRPPGCMPRAVGCSPHVMRPWIRARRNPCHRLSLLEERALGPATNWRSVDQVKGSCDDGVGIDAVMPVDAGQISTTDQTRSPQDALRHAVNVRGTRAHADGRRAPSPSAPRGPTGRTASRIQAASSDCPRRARTARKSRSGLVRQTTSALTPSSPSRVRRSTASGIVAPIAQMVRAGAEVRRSTYAPAVACLRRRPRPTGSSGTCASDWSTDRVDSRM